jgi:hypothetical protein
VTVANHMAAQPIPEPRWIQSWRREAFQRIVRLATEEEKRRHEVIREKVMKGFPPVPASERKPSPPGNPSQIRAACDARGRK